MARLLDEIFARRQYAPFRVGSPAQSWPSIRRRSRRIAGGSDDKSVAAYAKKSNAILITRDFDFADIRNYPPADYPGIIVLELPDDTTAGQVNRVLETFLTQHGMVEQLNGRLAIVETWRVRFRPAQSKKFVNSNDG